MAVDAIPLKMERPRSLEIPIKDSKSGSLETYRPDIDGLRAISIVSVVTYHAAQKLLPAGFVGVDIFFVISGYLIGGLIVDGLQRGDFSFAHFYARRIRRIFPALVIVLLASFLAAWCILFPGEFWLLGKHMVGAALFVSNYVLANEAGYFDVAATAKPLLHLWSLAIEEQFYLVWPLICWWAWRKHWSILGLTLFMLVVSFAINIGTSTAADAFYSPLSRFWQLNSGTAIALAQRHLRKNAKLRDWMEAIPIARRTALANLVALAGLASIGAAVTLPDATAYPGWWALLPVAGSAALIASGPNTWLHRHVLSQGPIVFVGLISYPLYLWHWPLISFAWIVYGSSPPPVVKVVLVAIAVMLASLTYYFIERPIRFRATFAIIVPALVGLLATAGVVGAIDMQMNGFENRRVAQINRDLALQLSFLKISESMGNHDSKIVGADSVD